MTKTTNGGVGVGGVGMGGARGRTTTRASNHSNVHSRRSSQRGSNYRRPSKGREAAGGAGGGLGRAAAAAAAAARSSSRALGAIATGTTATSPDGKPLAALSSEKKGAKLTSVVSLRRMCYLPGALLRSGLVYQKVTSLSLAGQGIGDGDIPTSVGRLVGWLRSVDLSRNRLTAVPEGLLQLGGGLEELNLGNNGIGELPKEVRIVTVM